MPLRIVAWISWLLLLGPGVSGRAAEAEFSPLFNGRDLKGWQVMGVRDRTPARNEHWRVEQGVLIGESDPALGGSILWTEKSYGDFVVEFDLRATGPEIDTGLRLRTPVGASTFEMQIGVSRSLRQDMTGSFLTDGQGDPTRYPESGRAKGVATVFKPGEWNTFRIEARGHTFTAWINDRQVAQYSNSRYAAPSPIGFQFHDGLKMKLEFRTIRLREL